MKGIWVALVVVVVTGWVWSAAPDGSYGSGSSGCIACHTDVKQLIRLSWEVEKIRGKPTVSALTEGEG
ncbi:MAG: hypothetical protein QNJ22_10575 [Desulfosarcinaceae bacterium]|nr:hypothetical protein [Desulfosarcinaceae bacterium]